MWNRKTNHEEETSMKRRSVGLAVGIVCIFGTMVAVSAEKPAGKEIKLCVAISGADSHVTKCRYLRITSADEWAKVWQEHKGQKPTEHYDRFYDPLALPQIDFDTYMVIGIFQGSSFNNAGLRAVSVSDEDNRILFRFTNKGYQTGSSKPGGGARKGKRLWLLRSTALRQAGHSRRDAAKPQTRSNRMERTNHVS